MNGKKDLAISWFESLRDSICKEFTQIEREKGSDANFEFKKWDRAGGGSGEMSVMYGEVFEKVGVNVSTVFGELDEAFAKEIPGTTNNRSFWASGISIVAHMHSPFVPAVHMNTRMIITEKLWFGGGADLTPTFPNEQDTQEFHAALKEACDKFNESFYPQFKKQCDEYFFIKHRNKTRGVGGIFYDYFNTDDWEKDFLFTQEVGLAFLKIFPYLVRKHYNTKWDNIEKEAQLKKRAEYAEFNLVYDRGTRFGFLTGGNVEAILMSLPPLCSWKQ